MHVDSLFYNDWEHKRKASASVEFAKYFEFADSIPSMPVIHWLPKYDIRSKLVLDIISGFSVGILLLPQSMAYCELAGLPPKMGLYSSTIPLIFYALYSDTTSTAIGPVSTTCIMIANALDNVGAKSMEEKINTATIMTFQVGIIFTLFGVLQLGWVVKLMSPAIMAGFITGVACIIPMSQFQHLFRLDMEGDDQTFYATFYHAMKGMSSIHWPTATLSILCCLIFIFARCYQLPRWIPTPLIVVSLCCIFSYVIDLESHGFQLIPPIPMGLPEYKLPDMARMSDGRLWISSGILACISYLSSIGLSKSFAIHRKEKINSNQEFFAYAFAHLSGAFFQSHVVSGSFSRTALNVALNAQTQISTLVQGFFVCICLLILTKPLAYLPRCVLSALIATSVFGLFKISVMKFLYQTNTWDFCFFMIAFIGTLTLGIEPGILLGCISQAASIVCRSALPRFSTLGKLPNTTKYVENGAFNDLESEPSIHIAQFGTDLIYTNMDVFERHIHGVLHTNGLRACIVDFSQVEYIDSAGVDILSQCMNIADELEVPLLLVSPPQATRSAINKGFRALDLSPPLYFLGVNAAIQFVRGNSAMKFEMAQFFLRTLQNFSKPWWRALTEKEKSQIITLTSQAILYYDGFCGNVRADLATKFGLTNAQIFDLWNMLSHRKSTSCTTPRGTIDLGGSTVQLGNQFEEAFLPFQRQKNNFRSVFVTF